VFMALLMIGVKHHGDFRAKIQHEFWLFKILIIAAMIFGSFFIPNSFFEGFGWVALVLLVSLSLFNCSCWSTSHILGLRTGLENMRKLWTNLASGGGFCSVALVSYTFLRSYSQS